MHHRKYKTAVKQHYYYKSNQFLNPRNKNNQIQHNKQTAPNKQITATAKHYKTHTSNKRIKFKTKQQ